MRIINNSVVGKRKSDWECMSVTVLNRVVMVEFFGKKIFE